jgi:hypothetical protein
LPPTLSCKMVTRDVPLRHIQTLLRKNMRRSRNLEWEEQLEVIDTLWQACTVDSDRFSLHFKNLAQNCCKCHQLHRIIRTWLETLAFVESSVLGHCMDPVAIRLEEGCRHCSIMINKTSSKRSSFGHWG